MASKIKKYFDESRMFYSAAIALLAINLIFSYAFLRPGWERAEELNLEYFSLRKDKTKMREEIGRHRASSASIEEMETDIGTFIKELPTEMEMTRIIEKIHSLAGKSGLAIREAKYTPSTDRNKELIHYTIVTPLSGPYLKVREFIYNMEKMPYLMNIEDLGLSSGKENTVSLSLKTSVYFRNNKE